MKWNSRKLSRLQTDAIETVSCVICGNSYSRMSRFRGGNTIPPGIREFKSLTCSGKCASVFRGYNSYKRKKLRESVIRGKQK
jgi:hypothetical protein